MEKPSVLHTWSYNRSDNPTFNIVFIQKFTDGVIAPLPSKSRVLATLLDRFYLKRIQGELDALDVSSTENRFPVIKDVKPQVNTGRANKKVRLDIDRSLLITDSPYDSFEFESQRIPYQISHFDKRIEVFVQTILKLISYQKDFKDTLFHQPNISTVQDFLTQLQDFPESIDPFEQGTLSFKRDSILDLVNRAQGFDACIDALFDIQAMTVPLDLRPLATVITRTWKSSISIKTKTGYSFYKSTRVNVIPEHVVQRYTIQPVGQHWMIGDHYTDVTHALSLLTEFIETVWLPHVLNGTTTNNWAQIKSRDVLKGVQSSYPRDMNLFGLEVRKSVIYNKTYSVRVYGDTDQEKALEYVAKSNESPIDLEFSFKDVNVGPFYQGDALESDPTEIKWMFPNINLLPDGDFVTLLSKYLETGFSGYYHYTLRSHSVTGGFLCGPIAKEIEDHLSEKDPGTGETLAIDIDHPLPNQFEAVLVRLLCKSPQTRHLFEPYRIEMEMPGRHQSVSVCELHNVYYKTSAFRILEAEISETLSNMISGNQYKISKSPRDALVHKISGMTYPITSRKLIKAARKGAEAHLAVAIKTQAVISATKEQPKVYIYDKTVQANKASLERSLKTLLFQF